VEWWYFNGHLTTESGLEYSFHFVTFQLVLPSGLTPRLAQLSWADHSKGIHLTAEQADLPLLKKSSGSFDLRLFNWSMTGDGSEYSLEFQTGDYDVAVQATSQKPATLHDGSGLVDLGIAGKTYYYSRTNLKASGLVSVAGQPQQVSGTAWMDHQWGDFSTRAIGWDWLSLDLDDGSELMVSVVWEQEGHKPITTYGTYVPQEGQAVHIPGDAIAFTPTGSWSSEATGAEYPMGWTLRVEPLEMDLTLTPVLTDAEFAVSAFIPVAYWEGAVTAEGARGQEAVTGKGFVEMVGYDAGSPGLATATPGPS
jgi:predicted secreted hydrolase